ncbi:MAG: hypothetical protein KDA16_12165, partial [Phycisphaerales bacterium]|nr:hypothetical protein [Phycisphaerales bacterium]
DEFRDGEKLIFKVEQIDLLAGDDDHDAADMSSMIPLADTGMQSAMAIDLTDSGFGSGSAIAEASGGMEESSMLSLEESAAAGSALSMGSGSALGAGDSGEQTGISVFDADDLDAADPSAVTQVSDGGGMEALQLDSMGSGSGLMDLTQEADDTSLGAEGLLDDIFAGDDTGSGGIGGSGETVSAEDTGLFEGTGGVGADLGGDEAVGAGAGGGAMVAMVAEPYDSRGSGLSGGFALGAALSMLAAIALGIMTAIGSPVEIPFVGTNILMLVGGMAGVTLLLGIIGFLVAGKGK